MMCTLNMHYLRTRLLMPTLLLTGVFFMLPCHAHVIQKGKKTVRDTMSLELPETVVTQHKLKLEGQIIDYTATTGHLTLKDEQGQERAHIFYIAYTQNGVNAKDRPVTFAFNGGPGSSSVWLHMGALGPKRVVMKENGYASGPPYLLEDNTYSWLDKTDLVFIDPVMTGYSRPAKGVDKKEFTGYKEDIHSVGDFIYRYITDNKRWGSPKYLCGESYGTTRAVGLSGYLQDHHGMYLNGLVLVSAVLHFQTLAFSSGNELPYTLFLPSYAATAYHHNKINIQKYPDFNAFIKEVETFAQGEYTHVLMKGDALTEEEKQGICLKMSGYTGLDPSFLRAHHCRIPTGLFTKELLRDSAYTIGRFDASIKGRDRQKGGDYYEFDPSYNLSVLGAYTAALHTHLAEHLRYIHPDLKYEILTGNVWPWNYKDFQNTYVNNSDVLRSAIHKNPGLKVLVLNGYYDLATPYFATEYTLSHLFLSPEYKKNISMTYYHGGHMMYTIKDCLILFTRDVRSFYANKS